MAIQLKRKATFLECVEFNHWRMNNATFKALMDLSTYYFSSQVTMCAVEGHARYEKLALMWSQELLDNGWAFGKDGVYRIVTNPQT